MATDRRDWLILSLKWSRSDCLMWYCTACAGYTTSVVLAGRYTREEARDRTCDGETLGVRLEDLMKADPGLVRLTGVMTVPNREALVSELAKMYQAGAGK